MLKEEILEQYQALIFDMDGTLIDTMSSHALTKYKPDPETFLRCVEKLGVKHETPRNKPRWEIC